MAGMFDGKSILITGGTGSFGKKCVEVLVRDYKPERVIVFSRDELKQVEMAARYEDPRVKFFIGNVRDKERLYRAFEGVDIIIHAAAMKHVSVAECNPLEAIRTNIEGGANVIDAALDCDVEKIIALSTDKAVNPVNLYGATKLCAEKLFTAANSYRGRHRARFSVVRYGNVLASRGSVIPRFMALRKTGVLPITDKRVTRFFITSETAVQFVLSCFESMNGGEIYIPKAPSMKLVDLATAICPECRQEEVGIRPGEKLHEMLVMKDESRQTIEMDDRYVIQPRFPWWDEKEFRAEDGVRRLPESFEYTSDTNSSWISVETLQQSIANGSLDIEALG
jgi:UDP-N-acetylglucosamine 4,6-dehydratase